MGHPAASKTPNQSKWEVDNNNDGLVVRVSAMEVELENVKDAVDKTSQALRQGFAETRAMFANTDERAAKRDTELHQRITQMSEASLQKGQWSMTTVAVVLTVMSVIATTAASIIVLYVSPIAATARSAEVDVHATQTHLATSDLNTAVAAARVEEQMAAAKEMQRHIYEQQQQFNWQVTRGMNTLWLERQTLEETRP